MGRIVRRFARFYELVIRGNFGQGAWGAGEGIEQYEADQILHSSVICTTALGGVVVAGLHGVHVNEDMTGDAYASRVRATVDANIVLTGNLTGTRTETEVLGATGEVTGTTMGHLIEMYSEAGCQFDSDVRGIFVSNYNLGTMNSTYELVRLEENGTAVPDNILGVYVLDATTFLHLTPNVPAGGAWSNVGDKTGGGGAGTGWIKVTVMGVAKYLQLY